MKKVIIIGALAFLAYTYRDKIFGKKTPSDTNSNEEPQTSNTLPLRELTKEEAMIYANKYQDLKDAYGYDIAKLQWHWFNNGYYEGRTVYEA